MYAHPYYKKTREIIMVNQRGDNYDESKQHIISVEQNMQSHV